MKKTLLTIFMAVFSLCLFAQQRIVKELMEGRITKEAFVEDMTTHFTKRYWLEADQQEKVRAVAERKADNYTIIAGLKNQPELFKRKMNAQTEHSIQSMQRIMTKAQFRVFMIDTRNNMKQLKADRK